MDAQTPRDMLTEIKAFTGLSEVALASELKVSQPTINRVLNSQDGCSSKTLMAILRMHGDLKAGRLAPAPVPAEAAAA
jgi:plasmid maintenance system antidote protein VapI